MKPASSGINVRRLRAALRDTWLLVREFIWPLLFLIVIVFGGGLLYFHLARIAGEPLEDPMLSIYHVLSLIFLQSAAVFPKIWYLQAFYFILPLLGLIIFAQGLSEFGVMLFNRKSRSREWEMAVASTYKNHQVVVGLGHLGYRVALNLHALQQDLVIIEANPKADLVSNIKHLGITVIQGDASRLSTLGAARIDRSQSIVLCTQDDSLNLQVALKARRLNPGIRVILRIFDDEFAQALHEQFGFIAFSATNMAAPAFAAATAGLEMTNPILVDGELLSLANLVVNNTSGLMNLTVGEFEEKFRMSIVLLKHEQQSDWHPSAEKIIMSDDRLMILGKPAEISTAIKVNGRS